MYPVGLFPTSVAPAILMFLIHDYQDCAVSPIYSDELLLAVFYYVVIHIQGLALPTALVCRNCLEVPR